MSVEIKRAYEPPSPSDGERILVDRVWPRGRTRDELRLEAWVRDVAPSTELRRWFGHDPTRWTEFERRYREELSASDRRALVDDLVARARRGRVTLVYGARDTAHNQARALANVIVDRLAG